MGLEVSVARRRPVDLWRRRAAVWHVLTGATGQAAGMVEAGPVWSRSIGSPTRTPVVFRARAAIIDEESQQKESEVWHVNT